MSRFVSRTQKGQRMKSRNLRLAGDARRACSRLPLVMLPMLTLHCTETLPGITGTQSLKVELVAPANPGTEAQRLGDSQRELRVKVTALDEQGQIDGAFNNEVAVHVQFLATLTPALGQLPLSTIKLTNGVAPETTVKLPPVFGPTTLWIEDSRGDNASYATGTTPTLWYRDPFISDFQTPSDENALSAFSTSPLETKQLRVTGSRYGERGRLVVTSVFAQGYTVSDVQCADAAANPPCTSQGYDHALIFSFSRPRDINGRAVELGQVITGFTGGVVEFNGLTELSFPQTFADATPSVDVRRIPAPLKVEAAWFTSQKINFEKNEAALISVEGAKMCPLDADFERYKQWKLALDGNCSNRSGLVNVISTGLLFDPAIHVNKTMGKVVGVLKPVNIAAFNVWIIYPRDDSDIAP